MKVAAFFLSDENNNFGDMLTKPVLEYYGYDITLVGRKYQGKVLGIGSVMSALRRNDIVWGTGCIRNKVITARPGNKFLAVRGQLTRSLIQGANVPEIYGDPALLLPLIYSPKVKQIYDVGIMPHYVDKEIVREMIANHVDGYENYHFIDIQDEWQAIVREMCQCRKIISSSLHGIIVADAYGIPANWATYSDKIIGGTFKFQDYFLGTGRERQTYGDIELLDHKKLSQLQIGLIKALEDGLK